MAEALKTCFVVCPIGDEGSPIREHSDTVFECYIEPALKEVGGFADPIRADRISKPGSIPQQVFEQIRDADLVIADLTGPNANVFYELGVRHTLKKRFVQMIAKGEKLPFDVNNMRTIDFELSKQLQTKKVIERLVAAINECYVDGFDVVTPLGYSVTLETLEKGDATDKSLKLILEKLDEVNGRVERQERAARSALAQELFRATDPVRRHASMYENPAPTDEQWVLTSWGMSISKVQMAFLAYEDVAVTPAVIRRVYRRVIEEMQKQGGGSQEEADRILLAVITDTVDGIRSSKEPAKPT